MKTSLKTLSFVSIAFAPAAAVAAAAGLSSAAPLGPATITVCLALVGLQLVAMSERRPRPAGLNPEAPPAPAYLPRRHVASKRRLHRNFCATS